MLTSLNWLKEYVNIDKTPEELEDILTNSGTKVETINPVNNTIKNIKAGLIRKIEKHPNADRLFICKVDIGEEAPITIVTSATNVFEGALVPVAVDGSVIGDGTEIRKTEFRGVESDGMFCSVEELGMNTDLFQKEILDGIYILPKNFVSPGTDLKEPLWINDQIIDIELTANRGDCQSIIGIAKETAAALNKDVKEINFSTSKGIENIDNYLKVTVESEKCPRYTARMFKVNKIEPSPLWMQLKLLNSGVRPINNIVDVTNYVMLEMGQPLHAFDYKSIGTDEIIVKTGNKEKTVTTLDEKERPIHEDMLMITNGKYPIAVAGIMGGLNSEITKETKLVVLESANFDKTSIRLTSKDLGLRTESSSRYEKGIYPELAAEASKRAAHLFEEINAATPIEGFIDIQTVKSKEPTEIILEKDWLNKFLGVDLELEEIINYLERLFLEVNKIDANTLKVIIPNYRQDLELREDLAEEVARLYGYNNIPSTLMAGETFVGERTPEQKLRKDLENLLTGLGHYQTMTTSFTSPNQIKNLGLNPDDDKVLILNPLGEESSLMRSTLLPHQLELISLNNNRGNSEGQFFEIQKTYHQEPVGELPSEQIQLVISEYGKDKDFYDLKGKVESVLSLCGIKNYKFLPEGSETWHPGRKAQVVIEDDIIGEIGEIHPNVVKNYDLPKRVYVADLSFNKLAQYANDEISYQDLPIYPDITRDLAFIIDKNILSDDLRQVIFDNAGKNLESIELFDVYTGNQIPEDKKSLAYKLVFRNPNRTLKDIEVNEAVDNIIKAVQEDLRGELRAF